MMPPHFTDTTMNPVHQPQSTPPPPQDQLQDQFQYQYQHQHHQQFEQKMKRQQSYSPTGVVDNGMSLMDEPSTTTRSVTSLGGRSKSISNKMKWPSFRRNRSEIETNNMSVSTRLNHQICESDNDGNNSTAGPPVIGLGITLAPDPFTPTKEFNESEMTTPPIQFGHGPNSSESSSMSGTPRSSSPSSSSFRSVRKNLLSLCTPVSSMKKNIRAGSSSTSTPNTSTTTSSIDVLNQSMAESDVGVDGDESSSSLRTCSQCKSVTFCLRECPYQFV